MKTYKEFLTEAQNNKTGWVPVIFPYFIDLRKPDAKNLEDLKGVEVGHTRVFEYSSDALEKIGRPTKKKIVARVENGIFTGEKW